MAKERAVYPKKAQKEGKKIGRVFAFFSVIHVGLIGQVRIALREGLCL